MQPTRENSIHEPTPGEIEAALDAMHRGSPEAFDRLLDASEEASSGICGLFLDMTARSAMEVAAPTISGYQIDRLLGAGGMGVVFAAEQISTHRAVAVKVIRGGYGVGAPADRLFRREVDTLVRLRHPNIADLYDAGTTSDGAPFFAMEFVDGQTFKESIQDAGDVDLKTEAGRAAIRQFVDVCRAMNHAHQRGVIHCDLKPTNVMIGSDGAPKVLDFGLSRLIDSDVSTIVAASASHHLAGTLAYMSPEQINGSIGDLDIRTDVYSLGVMLYELVCGKSPHRISGLSIPAAVRMISEREPKRPALIRPALRGDLDAIVMKSLEKDRERRYQSAGELADDLERALRGEPIEAQTDRFYLLRRTLYRYRVQAGVAAAFFVVLAAATAISTGFWIRSQREAARAQNVGNTAISTIGELMDEIYEVTTETINQPKKIERLEAQLQRLTDTIEMDPDLKYIRWTLLEMQARLAKSKGQLSRSRELLEQLLASAPPDSTWAADAHILYCDLVSANEARPHYEAAMAFELVKKEKCYLTRLFATVLMDEGRYAEALGVLESIDCFQSDIERGVVVGRAYLGLDRLDEARRAFRTSRIAAAKRVDGNSRPYLHKYRLLLAQQCQASFLYQVGERKEAFSLALQARQLSDQLLELKPFHVPTMLATSKIHMLICDYHMLHGELDEAKEAARLMFLNSERVYRIQYEAPTWQIERTDSEIRFAQAALGLDEFDLANRRVLRAIEHLESVSDSGRRPERDYQERFAKCYLLAVQIAESREDVDMLLEYGCRSVDTYLRLTALDPDDPSIEDSIVQLTLRLSAAERDFGIQFTDNHIRLAKTAAENFRRKGGDGERADVLDRLVHEEFRLTQRPALRSHEAVAVDSKSE